MTIKNIIKVLLFILPLSSFGQKDVLNKFKKIDVDTSHSISHVDNDDAYLSTVVNINVDVDIKNKPGDIFKINSLASSNIETDNFDLNVISVKQENNENTLALYVNNALLNTTQFDSDPLKAVYEILSLEEVKNKMGFTNPHDFHIVSIESDELGMTHIKMDQYYKGVFVFGGQIYIHLNNKNKYSFINGRWYANDELDHKFNKGGQRNLPGEIFTYPVKRARHIIENDLNTNGIEFRDTDDDLMLPDNKWKITKVYYPDEEKGFVPAYVFEVIVNALYRYKYLIDAQSGEFIRKQKEYCSLIPEDAFPPDGGVKAYAKDLNNITREINVYSKGSDYFMLDVSRDMFNQNKSDLPNDPYGVIWTIDAHNTHPNNEDFKDNLSHVHSNDNTWTQKAVSAHFNAGYAYNYYKTKFGRESINGAGGNVISIINVSEQNGKGMDNAFWGGTAMFYGNGNVAFTSPLAKALDVSGHELTHGVIQSTANLEYYGESGAINESFADVFGVMMDRDDWLLGEDVVNTSPDYFPSGALRNMSNPHNGASHNSHAWQPANTSEQYHGEQDNGGVHINSGIPNFAFYKFASAVGKDKAEVVYYRALTHYLTKSSKFVDLRIAIEQAAQDKYGSAVKDAASKAFDEVGIAGSSGGSTSPTDIEENPGSDYLIYTDNNASGLFLYSPASGETSRISYTEVASKPSISDNGRHVVFVGTDKKIHYIYLDWDNSQLEEKIIEANPRWRNAVISKDASHLAALTYSANKYISVYDFASGSGKDFELKNPTTADGVELGNVEFADAMEFDYSGEWIMYDCKNSFTSSSGVDIEYWDVGFIKVWDNKNNKFGSGRVEKLFSELPEDVSIGNPTFSKNSPYIITFDYINDNNYYVLGANLETGDVGTIFSNNDLGYPNYSIDDKYVLFTYNNSGTSALGVVPVDNTKIKGDVNNANKVLDDSKWGVWFANGVRDFSSATFDINDLPEANVTVYPNPTQGQLSFSSEEFKNEKVLVRVYDILGNVTYSANKRFVDNQLKLEINDAHDGIYFVHLYSDKYKYTAKVQLINK